MKKYLVIFFAFLTTCACLFSCTHEPLDDKMDNLRVVRIEITTDAKSDKMAKSVTLTDKERIGEIVYQLNKLVPTTDSLDLTNRQFIRLNIHFEDGTAKELNILYTIYNGIVIFSYESQKNRKHLFKNNALELKLVEILIKEQNARRKNIF